MVARGLAAPNFSVARGSALTKSCRPVGSETLAIWAPARGAKKLAQRTSVPRRSPAVIAVRFTIVPRGKANTIFATRYRVYSFRHCPVGVNVSSVLGAPPNGLPLGENAWRVVVLRSRAGRKVGSVRAVLGTARLGRVRRCSRPDGFWRYRGPARAARTLIITKARGGRGYSIGHFLGQLCLFRQPRPGPVCRPRSRPPAWPAPVSACQHGL